MLETLTNCPICQKKEFLPFLTCNDHTVSHERFSLVKCQNCSFTFTNPRPTQSTTGVYYESEDYISHSDTQKGLVNQAYHWVRKRALKYKVNILNKHFPKQPSNLLDYGCGTGAFADFCKKNGWNVDAIEPNAKARQMAEKQLEKMIFEKIEDINPAQTFDIITLWHVLEHIHELSTTLAELKKRLSINGRLVVAVPNLESLDAKKFKENWAAFDVPRHLWHFSQKNINELMQTQGLKVDKVLPLYYDSFYISLLSTRYQTGKIQYLRAFWIGIYSNLKAFFGKKDYSSVIYIIKNG